MLDTSLGSRVEKIIGDNAGLDNESFRENFGLELGRYRFAIGWDMPPVLETLKLLCELHDVSDELAIRIDHMPADAEAYVEEKWWQLRKELFYTAASRLTHEIYSMQGVFAEVRSEMEKLSKAGRRTSYYRDTLIRKTLALINAQGVAVDQHSLAWELLGAASVPRPADVSSFKKLCKRLEKN